MFCSFLQGGGVWVYSATVTMTSCSITGNTASGAVRAHVQNFPSPRWENALLRWDFHMPCALCFQGGGVYVSGGTVTFSSCTITGNTAAGVRAQLKSSHRPDGKMADVLASTLARTTATDALVNYRRYVP